MKKNNLTMWEKVSFFPVAAKMAIEERTKEFFEDFKNDEGGLEVVQTVLVVLVGVLLIAGLWIVLGPWISAIWQDIVSESDTITGNPFGG